LTCILLVKLDNLDSFIFFLLKVTSLGLKNLASRQPLIAGFFIESIELWLFLVSFSLIILVRAWVVNNPGCIFLRLWLWLGCSVYRFSLNYYYLVSLLCSHKCILLIRTWKFYSFLVYIFFNLILKMVTLAVTFA